MKPIDKFTIEEYIPKEEELLDYVEMLGCSCYPRYDYNDQGEVIKDGTAVTSPFKNRYNQRSLHAKYKYEDYLKNQDIQDTLHALHIDIDKFWYLLLFVSDFIYGECVAGNEVKDIPVEVVNRFTQQLYNNIDQQGDTFTFIKKTTLILRTEGEEQIEINSPTALACLCSHCMFTKSLLDEGKIEGSKAFNRLEEIKDPNNKEGNIVLILDFTRLLKEFLCNILPPILPYEQEGTHKVQAYTTVSLNKMLLISRLIYFTGLSADERYTGYDKKKDKLCPNHLKDQLKYYSDYKISRLNNIYF